MSNPCTLADCTCHYSSCRDPGRRCDIPCNTLARIQKRVRMPMFLYTQRQSAFAIGVKHRGGDPFKGPADRFQSNGQPWGGAKGVAKKHNSYARYLGRKKAPVLRADMTFGKKHNNGLGCGTVCCCWCEQTIAFLDTGTFLFLVEPGDTVTQPNTGATGTVLFVIRNAGTGFDHDGFVARVDDCIGKPFINSGNAPLGGIITFSRGGVATGASSVTML